MSAGYITGGTGDIGECRVYYRGYRRYRRVQGIYYRGYRRYSRVQGILQVVQEIEESAGYITGGIGVEVGFRMLKPESRRA